MKQKKFYWILGLAFLGLALLAPLFLPRFQLRMITEVIILSLFALTWKMLLNEGGCSLLVMPFISAWVPMGRFWVGYTSPACLSSAEFF